jgi:hypothetical protein
VAAVAGFACADAYPGKTCANEGFVTKNAWGYRARISATYKDVVAGASVILSFQYMRDVEGYSYDFAFVDDRRISRPSIRAEWGKKYFAEVAYTHFSDSPKYSLVVDRDNVVMFAGMRF